MLLQWSELTLNAKTTAVCLLGDTNIQEARGDLKGFHRRYKSPVEYTYHVTLNNNTDYYTTLMDDGCELFEYGDVLPQLQQQSSAEGGQVHLDPEGPTHGQ